MKKPKRVKKEGGVKIINVDYDKLPEEVDRDSLSDNGAGKEYASYFLIYHNDKLIRCESDAMEREDAVFFRDLSWIKGAIEEAYKIGLAEKSE